MTPFNIEIFHPDFTFVQHYTLGEVVYQYDYLSPVENSIVIPYNEEVLQGDYIYIRGDTDYFGVITTISQNGVIKGCAEIRYKPFISLFNAPILFDTSLQGTSTLEQVLADIISDLYINNSDDDQNIAGLSVTTLSSTSSWGFNIKSDVEGLAKAIINLYDVLIVRSLTKYRVGLYATPNFESQSITLSIGIQDASSMVIEADLPTIITKNITITTNNADINKLVVYDQTDMATYLEYYKHSDGTYDTTDSDRITPVIFTTKSVDPGTGTFADAAESMAADVLGGESYNNLIELTVSNEDTLVMPSGFTIGQQVEIISNGTSYTSIFTGMVRNSHTKLVFGAIRMDLTKILKGAISNG